MADMTPAQPDGTMAVLAAEVERLRRSVESAVRLATDAKASSDVASGQVIQLVRDVASLTALGTQVRVLADRVTDLAAGTVVDGNDALAALVSWFDVTPDQAGRVLVEVAEWLSLVGRQYQSLHDSVGDCWYRHPAAVDALNALRAGWCAVYRNRQATPSAAADWHTRQLPGLTEVLRSELRGCSETNHGPNGSIAASRRAQPLLSAADPRLDEYARWWGAGHGDGAEPGLPGLPSTAR